MSEWSRQPNTDLDGSVAMKVDQVSAVTPTTSMQIDVKLSEVKNMDVAMSLSKDETQIRSGRSTPKDSKLSAIKRRPELPQMEGGIDYDQD